MVWSKPIYERNDPNASIAALLLIEKELSEALGKTHFIVRVSNEEDILVLYPDYSVEAIPESIRQWIEYGIWEEDKILQDISSANKGKRAEDIP